MHRNCILNGISVTGVAIDQANVQVSVLFLESIQLLYQLGDFHVAQRMSGFYRKSIT
jgi:hypothetical protein